MLFITIDSPWEIHCLCISNGDLYLRSMEEGETKCVYPKNVLCIEILQREQIKNKKYLKGCKVKKNSRNIMYDLLKVGMIHLPCDVYSCERMRCKVFAVSIWSNLGSNCYHAQTLKCLWNSFKCCPITHLSQITVGTNQLMTQVLVFEHCCFCQRIWACSLFENSRAQINLSEWWISDCSSNVFWIEVNVVYSNNIFYL